MSWLETKIILNFISSTQPKVIKTKISKIHQLYTWVSLLSDFVGVEKDNNERVRHVNSVGPEVVK